MQAAIINDDVRKRIGAMLMAEKCVKTRDKSKPLTKPRSVIYLRVPPDVRRKIAEAVKQSEMDMNDWCTWKLELAANYALSAFGKTNNPKETT